MDFVKVMHAPPNFGAINIFVERSSTAERTRHPPPSTPKKRKRSQSLEICRLSGGERERESANAILHFYNYTYLTCMYVHIYSCTMFKLRSTTDQRPALVLHLKNLWHYGIHIFSPFWYIVSEKSGNPARGKTEMPHLPESLLRTLHRVAGIDVMIFIVLSQKIGAFYCYVVFAKFGS
jgi:hypothetical protein